MILAFMRDLLLCTPVTGTKRIKWGQPHGRPWGPLPSPWWSSAGLRCPVRRRLIDNIPQARKWSLEVKATESEQSWNSAQSFASATGSQQCFRGQDPVLGGPTVIHQPLQQAGPQGSGNQAVFCADLLKYSRLAAFSLCGILLRRASWPNELTPLAGITLSSSVLQVPRALFMGLVLCVIHPSAVLFLTPPRPPLGRELYLLLPGVLCSGAGGGGW